MQHKCTCDRTVDNQELTSNGRKHRKMIRYLKHISVRRKLIEREILTKTRMVLNLYFLMWKRWTVTTRKLPIFNTSIDCQYQLMERNWQMASEVIFLKDFFSLNQYGQLNFKSHKRKVDSNTMWRVIRFTELSKHIVLHVICFPSNVELLFNLGLFYI